jgi:hypothetical protein
MSLLVLHIFEAGYKQKSSVELLVYFVIGFIHF